MAPWFQRVWRSFGRRGKRRPRRHISRPLTFEVLEGRDLLSVTITELPTPTSGGGPSGIASGSDGALWFTESNKDKIGRVTTAGAFTEYPVPTANSQPDYITSGPDGALWFTELNTNQIGRVTTAGAFTEFAVPTANSKPSGITSGPDGALWFTEYAANQIGRVTTAGAFTEYAIPTASSQPLEIVTGPDGALWFTEFAKNQIGRVTTAGVFTEYAVPTGGSQPWGITAGPDGALWFTESGKGQIGRVTTGGVFTEYPTSKSDTHPEGITAGPDGALWFTENAKGQIGRITTAGALTEYATSKGDTHPEEITAGPDGALWFTENSANKISQATTPNSVLTVTGVDITANEGVPFSGTVATFTDSDPTRVAGNFTATIDWGDGTTSPANVTGSGPFSVSGNHTYAEEGPYTLTVSVKDNGGPSGLDTSSATVADAPLSAAGSSQTYSATEGAATGPQVVAQFADPGTDGTAADYSATISWGDGSTSTGTVSLVSGTTFQVTGGHTYAEEGSYPISVTITDAGGAPPLTVNSATFSVADAPLSPAGTPQTYSANEGAGTGAQVLAQFTDPGTDGTAADYTAAINWGDGSTSTGVVSLVSGSTFRVVGAHAYAEEGSYPVSVTITDAGGAPPLVVSGTAFAVADAPLSAAGTPQTYSATEATSTGPQVVAQFSDPGTDGTAADYTATVAWGDGSTSTGAVSLVSGGLFQVAGSHTYAEEGSYPVQVTITDAGGAAPLVVSTAAFSVADAPLGATGATQTYAAAEGAGAGPQVVAQFSDPGTDGTAADYTATISWGDGTTSAGTVSLVSGSTFQVTGSHAYAEEGSYPVSVTVADSGGAAPLTVSGASFSVADAPLSAAGPPAAYSAVEGAGTGPQVLAQFSDPGSDGTAADCTATISWGDGSTSTGVVSLLSGSTFQVVGAHAYGEEGTFPVSVTVTDAGGAAPLVVSAATFSVADAPLSATGATQAYSASEGAGSGPRVVAQFTDPGTDGTTADYSATIDWGDGTTSTGTVSLVSGTTFQVVGAHAYAEEGSYPVSVTITDAGGAPPLAVSAATFAVADAALSPGGAAQTYLAAEGAGTGTLVVAQFTDPGTDGTVGDYSATIDWGDGTTSTGAVSLVSGTTFQVAGAHAYAEEGGFPVTVTVTDSGGASPLVVSTTTFNVADAPLSAAGSPQTYLATEGASAGPQVVAQFSDAGTDGTVGDYSATIDWGDGITSAGTVSLVSGTTFQVAGSHTYSEEGSYPVSVTVADAGGAPPLAVSGATFSVADAPLSAAGAAQTYAATEGAAVGPQVVAQFSDPGTDGTTADYGATIDWGDGTTSAGTVSLVSGTTFQVTGSHAYGEQGTYPVSVTITDGGGAVPLVVNSATFAVADAALSAAGAAQTYPAAEGAGTGTLVVAQFTDPGTDGTTTDYTATISWGDGTTSPGTVSLVSGTTFQVTGAHSYSEEGSYPVSVTITDSGGAAPLVVSSATFAVADAPLSAAGGPLTYSAAEGAGTGPQVLAQFVDPGTDGTAADYTATISWGDGTTSPGTVSLVSGNLFQVAGGHTYAEEGRFPVSVTITDSGGAPPLTVGTTTFSVADAPLTAAGGPQTYSAAEGTAAGAQVVAQFADPGTDGTAGDYTATIDWGDGSTSTGSVSLVSGTTFQVAGGHTYSEEGSFPVQVTITDSGGAAPLVVSGATFSVADAPLSAAGSPQTYSAIEGATTTPQVVAQFTDPGTDGTAADYSATISWGDGTTSAGAVSLVSGGTFQVAGAHAYAEEGSFPVSVTVTDSGGASPLVVRSTTFFVADAPLSPAGSPQTYAVAEGAGTGMQVVAQFGDPGTDGTAADYSATIAWGDGTTSTGAVSLVSGTTFKIAGSHAYAEEGSFPVQVTITDVGGAAPLVVSTATFAVADAPLSRAGAARTYSAVEGAATGPLAVAQFTDPGTDGATADYGATIDWGDGTTSTGTISPVSGTTFQVSGTHAYAEEGAYNVSVRVTDAGGAPTLVVSGTTFNVTDAPLSAVGPALTDAATEGTSTGPQVVAQFADPGTDGTAADYSATIDWGDGSSSAGLVRSEGGTFQVVGAHAYAEEGSFPVSVTVQDVGGASPLVINSITFGVADAPLTAAGGSLTFAAVEAIDTGARVLAQFTDPNPAASGADYGVTIDWGDGTTSAGAVALVGGNTFQVVGDHVYAAGARYPVAVTVRDLGGAPPLVINSVTFSVADATPGGSPTRPAPSPPPPPAAPAPTPSRPSAATPSGADATDSLVLVSLVVPATPPSSASLGGGHQNDAGLASLAVMALLRSGAGTGLGQSGGGDSPDVAQAAAAVAQADTPAPDAPNADATPAKPAPGKAPAAVRTNAPAPATRPQPVTAVQPDKPLAPPAPAVAHLHKNFLWQSLDKVGDDLAGQPRERKAASVALTTVALATAGYVLLTGRAGSWLLSVLTSQPLWKEYDPLAVLLAREKERKRARGPRDNEDEETLQSLVG